MGGSLLLTLENKEKLVEGITQKHLTLQYDIVVRLSVD
jgi:hypothetical protein